MFAWRRSAGGLVCVKNLCAVTEGGSRTPGESVGEANWGPGPRNKLRRPLKEETKKNNWNSKKQEVKKNKKTKKKKKKKEKKTKKKKKKKK